MLDDVSMDTWQADSTFSGTLVGQIQVTCVTPLEASCGIYDVSMTSSHRPYLKIFIMCVGKNRWVE